MTCAVNTDKFRVCYDKLVTARHLSDGTEVGAVPHRFRVPINKKITYKADSGGVPSGANCYGLYVVAFEGNTVDGTVVGTYDVNIKHVFTDF